MITTRGLLITLEGIDGCGKTTQAELLGERLGLSEIDYLKVREPGGTAAGEEIRRVLLDKKLTLSLQAELLLYNAARSELIDQVIRPALIAGTTVICDRFTDSTVAYQGYAGGLNLDWVRAVNAEATGNISPHLTLLFDLPVEDAVARRSGISDRMEEKDRHFHWRVQRGYLQMAALEPQRIKVIDASGSAEEQNHVAWALVMNLMHGRAAERPADEL